MGDRVSISFKNGEEESIALFSHWRGRGLVEDAQYYVQVLRTEAKAIGSAYPLYRGEPGTVMVDFIRYLTHREERIKGDLYVGQMSDPMWGDNGDNGHHVIDLGKGG